jgi:mRNA interferase RelE/StbE
VGSYKVFVKRSALKEIEALPTLRDRQRVVRRIRSLARDPRPRGCQKLSGAEKYRVREGRYRILYRIEDDALIVTVVRVAHRKAVYR